MKINYRGCEIEAKREQCLAGYPLVFYSVFTEDGFEVDSGFMDTADTVRTVIKDLKTVVDDFIANPGDWEED
jgi:hypothetical protein